MPEPTRERCYFFNSFFYKKLSEKQPGLGPVNTTGRCDAAKAAHERVRKWTKVTIPPALEQGFTSNASQAACCEFTSAWDCGLMDF